MTHFNHLLRYLGVCLLALFTHELAAQPDVGRHKNLQLNVGLSWVTVKDFSLTPLRYSGTGLKLGATYEWGKSSSRNNALAINYRGGALSNEFSGFPNVTINYGNIQYRHLRSVGNSGLKVGGVSSVFFYLKTSDDLNSNSYDAGANVGIAVAYGPRRLFNDKWGLSMGFTLPVVAYYIRPVYGEPFPSKFLTEDNFSVYFEPGDIVSSLPTSGEIVSFDTYFEVSTYVEFVRSLTDMFDEIRFRYHWNYLQFKSLESSYYAEQSFSVSLIKHLDNPSNHEK